MSKKSVPFNRIIIYLVVALLVLASAIAAAVVSHRASDVQVTFQGSPTDAQSALRGLWGSVRDGSLALWNKCLLVGDKPQEFAADDLNGVPLTFNSVTSGHHARQVILTLADNGPQMSVQGAVVGIATEITRVKNNKVNYACRSYCKGTTLVTKGTCNDAGWCGDAYAAGTGTDCLNTGQICETTVDALGEPTGAQCKAKPAGECSGDLLRTGYSCISASDCGYRSETNCAATQQRCDSASLTCINCGNGRCDSGETSISCPADGCTVSQASTGTILGGQSCGLASVNKGKTCESGTSCYDSNGDNLGVCLTPEEIGARQNSATGTGSASTGVADANSDSVDISLA